MHNICTYHIEVRCQLAETAFNASSPLQINVLRTNRESTLFAVRADQSGLIGLIRHLHGQGFTLLSIQRKLLTVTMEQDQVNCT